MLVMLQSLKEANYVLSFSDEVKILDVIERNKNRMRCLPGCMARTNLPFVKLRRTKKNWASFYVAPQTAKVSALVRDNVLLKVGKKLKFLGGRYE
jgi:hypothetical protein